MRKKIKYTKVSSIYIKDAQPINNAILQSVKDLGIEKKLNERLLLNFWKKLFGPSISNVTTKIVLNNYQLSIFVSSSVIKSDLQMSKSKILQRFQEKFGTNNIRYINIY